MSVDKDDNFHPTIVIDGEVEHGAGSGHVATELFFSKYFEAEGNAKMLAIFNGTNASISLADVTILQRQKGGSSSHNPFSLASYGKVPGTIQSGEEIILYARDNNNKIMECAENDPSFETWNDVGTNNKFQYGGKATIRLFRGNKCIDIIGAMKSDAEDGDINDITKEPLEGTETPSWGDDKGFVVATGDNYSTKDVEENNYGLSTNRCLLIRKAFVTSGDSAIWNNYGDFKTLGAYTGIDGKAHKSEWAGLQIATAYAADGKTKTYANTCAGFQEVGHFDYSDYYKDWMNIDPGQELDGLITDDEAGTYEIPIPELAKYSCLNIRFQLKNTAGEVVTEAPVQVPIIVKDGHTTIDAIFNEIVKTDGGDPLYDESIIRCKTCDVIVLGTGVLTKATDGATNDVPEVGNVKVYPGGKLIVPTGTSYSINSLAFRRQEDEVPTANIQGNLTIKENGNHVYLDLRIDPTNWHYITLPYDCKVSDIRFVGDEMKIPILGTDYLLKYYDGKKRAATQSGGCWEMVAPDATLKKGIGYIFGLPGDGKVKREFRFPMSNNIINEEKDPEGKLASGVYAFGGDKDMTEVRANHRGWNLVGDPYLLPYTSDIGSPVMTGYIVEDYSTDPWDGHYKFADDARSNLRYIVEPVDNGRSEYIQVPITNYSMKPFTCYFVQIGGSNPDATQGVQFNLNAVNRGASVVRRSPALYEEQEDTHPVWCAVTITSPQGETDETTMLISDEFTDGYDMMDDLVKMRGTYYQYAQITTKPVLASRNDEGEMAFNALPDASAEAGIPLHYFAATQGEYVIAYDDKYGREEVKAVMLLDKQTNEWHDLMNDSYTFYTNRIDDKDRFMLTVRVERKKEPQIITGLEEAGEYDAPRKILLNDHVYILRGGVLYDITGKQMLNR